MYSSKQILLPRMLQRDQRNVNWMNVRLKDRDCGVGIRQAISLRSPLDAADGVNGTFGKERNSGSVRRDFAGRGAARQPNGVLAAGGVLGDMADHLKTVAAEKLTILGRIEAGVVERLIRERAERFAMG